MLASVAVCRNCALSLNLCFIQSTIKLKPKLLSLWSRWLYSKKLMRKMLPTAVYKVKKQSVKLLPSPQAKIFKTTPNSCLLSSQQSRSASTNVLFEQKNTSECKKPTPNLSQNYNKTPLLAFGSEEKRLGATNRLARTWKSAHLEQKRTGKNVEDLIWHLGMKKRLGSPRKVLFVSQQENGKSSVIGVPTGKSYDLNEVMATCSGVGLSATFIEEDYKLALYVCDRKEESEFFVFSDGVVVFWGVEDTYKRSSLLKFLKEYISVAYPAELTEQETEYIPFEIHNNASTRMKKDKILLNENDHVGMKKNSDCSILERYAFAHGLAMSVKLGVWEHMLDQLSEVIEQAAEEMKNGRVTIKRQKIFATTGQLYKLRYGINLGTQIMSYHDVFWERQDLEKLCEDVSKSLDINNRCERIISNLDSCLDFLQLLEGLYSNKHSIRLERIIIALIAVEIAVALLPEVRSYFAS